MNINDINFTPKDILEKDFKIDTRGYRPVEVDKFLDEVIKDYEKMFALIKNLKSEENNLRNEILALKEQLRSARANIEIASRSERNVPNNVDVLKRLSDLEKTVYGQENN